MLLPQSIWTTYGKKHYYYEIYQGFELFNYLHEKNKFKDQSGFQPGDSTETQLSYLYDFKIKS